MSSTHRMATNAAAAATPRASRNRSGGRSCACGDRRACAAVCRARDRARSNACVCARTRARVSVCSCAWLSVCCRLSLRRMPTNRRGHAAAAVVVVTAVGVDVVAAVIGETCACVCVLACMRVCVRTRVRMCVRARVRAPAMRVCVLAKSVSARVARGRSTPVGGVTGCVPRASSPLAPTRTGRTLMGRTDIGWAGAARP